MRTIVDVLVGLAVLAFLLAVGFRFLSPDMGFALSYSFVTPVFLWRGGMGLLTLAVVLLLRQIRDEIRANAQATPTRDTAVPLGSRSV